MRFLVLATGLGVFALVSLAVRYHFVTHVASPKFIALSLLSAVNIFIFGRELWLHQQSTTQLAIALGLFIAGTMLFCWSLQASRTARLKLIFEPDDPQHILQRGPYRHIRHPFYASYVIFWLGCAIATLHPANIAYFMVLIPMLVLAARTEERGFEGSPLATEYARYRRSAGLLWPKLWH